MSDTCNTSVHRERRYDMPVTSNNEDPFGSEKLYEMMKEYNDRTYGNVPSENELSDSGDETRNEQKPSNSEKGTFSRLGTKVIVSAVICLVMILIAAPALIKLLAFLIDFAIVVGAACLACWGIRRAIEAIESRNARKAQETRDAGFNTSEDGNEPTPVD